MRTVSRCRATGLPSVMPSGVGLGVSFALDVGFAEWVDVLDDPCALSATEQESPLILFSGIELRKR